MGNADDEPPSYVNPIKRHQVRAVMIQATQMKMPIGIEDFSNSFAEKNLVFIMIMLPLVLNGKNSA